MRTALSLIALSLAVPALHAQATDPAAEARRQAAILDGSGKGAEARVIWQRFVDGANEPADKAQMQRQMAMSWGFEGDCPKAISWHTMVIDYWKSRERAEPQNAFYQEGEMANESARVCIDAGDLDNAERMYRLGYELGNKEPEPRTHPASLWEFRLTHAEARLAARRGNKPQADSLVAKARAILDADTEMARPQERFFPYLAGYVALYTNDLATAEQRLGEALAIQQNQADPFLTYLSGITQEREGHAKAAREIYEKAYKLAEGNHNPPAAAVRRELGKRLNPQGLRKGFVLVADQEVASASLIDLSTDEMRLIPVGTGPHEATISPSGKTGVVTIYGDRTPGNQLAIVDIATGTVARTISLGQYTRPHGVVFLPGDESRVVVTSETTQNVVVVNIKEGKVEGAVPTGAKGSHMAALTANGKRVFTSNVYDGGVSEIDLTKRALVRAMAVAPQVEGIAVTPDGKTVFAGSNKDGTVSVIDTRTGAITDTIRGFKLPYRLATSADGSIVIVCDPDGNAVTVIDVATHRVAWTLRSLASPRGVRITPDGKTAFVTLAGDPSVGIVDLVARKLVRTIFVGASPDGVGYGRAP